MYLREFLKINTSIKEIFLINNYLGIDEMSMINISEEFPTISIKF